MDPLALKLVDSQPFLELLQKASTGEETVLIKEEEEDEEGEPICQAPMSQGLS
jgi:hypothetical protein